MGGNTHCTVHDKKPKLIFVEPDIVFHQEPGHDNMQFKQLLKKMTYELAVLYILN